MPADSANCPQCHTPLPPAAPRGLCPACLMDAASGDADTLPAADAFGAPLDLEALRRAFPQLEILAPLGAGGMGRVYKVRQPNLDRIVALKVVPPAYTRDPAWVERFTREARALARLNHPNIVQVYDFGQTAESPATPPLCWLLMEYVDGVSLRQVQRTGGLSSREALALIPKLCDALQYAHEKGVLHRDIKPENILLDAAGTAKIADFGLAKLGGTTESPALTLTGARLGTAAYMAPEQIESPADVDHRADIYSLGVVFYELLTGGLPLGRFPAPSEKSGTDPRLDHIVFRTLEKERDRRYQAAGEVRTALETVAASPQPPPLPKDSPQGTPQAWDFHRVPTPAGADALRVKPEPRIHRTTRPLTGGERPVPPEGVVKVTYKDRNRPFPGSGAESLGYGCGWMLGVPLRFALAIFPAFVPILWFEFLGEWRQELSFETWRHFTAPVIALTGFLGWLCVGPLFKATRFPEREAVKRKAPLLLLLALLIWGGVLTLYTLSSRKWPNIGTVAGVELSCMRPSIPAGGGKNAVDIEALWTELQRSEFPEASALTEHGAQLGWSRYYEDAESDPLRMTLRGIGVGLNANHVNQRINEFLQKFMVAIPKEIRSGVEFQISGFGPGSRLWPIRTMDFDLLAWAGVLMAAGGWLAGLAGARPILKFVAPLMVLGAVYQISVWQTMLVRDLSKARMSLARKSKVESAARALLPPAAGEAEAAGTERWFLSWVDACRRRDRDAALQYCQQKEEVYWGIMARFWSEHELINLQESTAPGDGAKTMICLVVERTNDPYGENLQFQSYTLSNSRHSRTKSFVITGVEGGWKIMDVQILQ